MGKSTVDGRDIEVFFIPSLVCLLQVFVYIFTSRVYYMINRWTETATRSHKCSLEQTEHESMQTKLD